VFRTHNSSFHAYQVEPPTAPATFDLYQNVTRLLCVPPSDPLCKYLYTCYVGILLIEIRWLESPKIILKIDNSQHSIRQVKGGSDSLVAKYWRWSLVTERHDRWGYLCTCFTPLSNLSSPQSDRNRQCHASNPEASTTYLPPSSLHTFNRRQPAISESHSTIPSTSNTTSYHQSCSGQ
jgi:hypothetical protein